MATPLRFIPDDTKLWPDRHGHPIAVVEVTTRTVQGRFLLKPTQENTSLILGVLGRAQHRYDFDLFGYAFLSNHYSLLLGVRSPEHLAAILCYINSNIARELGRTENSDWKEKFWGRRSRCILVLTDDDLRSRLRYLLANSTKEHLVKRPDRWPGAHCARPLCTGQQDTGAWVDRTELRRLRHIADKGRRVSQADATTYYPVRLSVLPCWAQLDASEQRRAVRQMCREISDQAAAERQASGGAVQGIKRLLRYSPHHKPESLSSSPAPHVHCMDQALRSWFLQAYRRFVAAYQEAHSALVSGLCAFRFPEGGPPPTRLALRPG